MSKRQKTDEIKLSDVMTVKSYLDFLKKRGIETSKQTIHYQLEKTDNLDYCEWQGMKLVIINNKSINFTPKGS